VSRIAYVNGRYLPQRQASVNIEDRGYQFADGVYEVIYLQGGRCIDEELHLDRLERSLRQIRLRQPVGRPVLRHILSEVARRNRITEGLLYMQVTRGVARREHPFPPNSVAPSLVVTIRRTPPYPDDPARWAVSAITYPDQRWRRCDIKSVGLLPNVLARQAAREQGAYEAILVDAAGNVTEGAATSVWIVDAAGSLRSRALDELVLPGCTRAALMTLLRQESIEFSERGFTVAELRGAREAFLTSASSFIKPVLRLDGAAVGEGRVGPVTCQLFEMFARHVTGGLRNAA
jgi:D-alanine transaminase